MRLSSEERRAIAQWLELARSHFERHTSFEWRMYFAQAPEHSMGARAEGGDITGSFTTEIVTCHFVDLPGDWAQWIACDPRNDEPLIFGEVYQSQRKRDEKHGELMRWIRYGAR